MFLSDVWSLFNGLKYALIIWPLPFLLCKGSYWGQSYSFKLTYILCFCFMLLNIITCYLYRGQSVLVSISEWTPLYLLCFYPTFVSWRQSPLFWENILITLYVVFVVIFALQYFARDKFFLFYLDNDFEGLLREDRVRLFSDGILYLGSLLCLNKYLCDGKVKYFVLFVLGALCIFIEGYRMLIVCYIPIILGMIYKLHKFNKSLVLFILVGGLAIAYIAQSSFGQDKYNQMLDRNQRDNFENGDYVRVLLVNYYYTEHFIDYLEMFLGSGMPQLVDPPSKAKSNYSKDFSEKAALYHFYPVDMGLIGLSWNAGIPFTVCFVVLMLSVLRHKLPKEYYYLWFWELYIVIVGTTNELSYYHSNVIYQAIVLAIISSIVDVQERNKEGLVLRTKKTLSNCNV